ncbi:hypothetical protein M2459_003103 [Parabacteroides sp. PF5-5]|nr:MULTISPECIES: hypothetical protein [unclassified Parabacteroides]MDH6305893.1 hypothetical protein [Parabacteroides sp. PH5-39]MDH6317294.1 hypothetical protein [Parabacteroides sp. PF5-13]MDH6320502.1 hypothetical protein [Parabacteroides sp. PH5-13]MDH6324336.1 hypothetical protein [Parabacteroides sp. PH5-8]MDH6328532.1 hypothetical protein [Parabacteroides sp. PH5-41]
MKVSELLLEEATLLVENTNNNLVAEMAACGCFGCGMGCSGTVGM